MFYNGIAYPYAFEVRVPAGDIDRTFSIAISNYRDNTKDYTGLCLENELIVTSKIKVSFLAFYEIINKVETITLKSEELHSKLVGHKSSPLVKVEDPEVLKVFEKCKYSTKSLEYYEKLMGWVSKPESFLEENIDDEIRIDVLDGPQMILFFTLFHKESANKYVKFTRT